MTQIAPHSHLAEIGQFAQIDRWHSNLLKGVETLIYAFVAIIFVYVVLMNRLDRRFNVDDRDRRRRR